MESPWVTLLIDMKLFPVESKDGLRIYDTMPQTVPTSVLEMTDSMNLFIVMGKK